MKKLYYLLLLSLFTSFILMSNDQENKNKVLAQQLSTINTQFQKWKKELEGYKKWALENDGAVSAEEQAEIDRRQKDMDAILARVAQIVKAKGLLAFMGLPTKEETKATAETKEEAPMTTEIETKEETPITTEIESKAEMPATTNTETVEVEYAMGKKGGPNPELTVTVLGDDIPKKGFGAVVEGIIVAYRALCGEFQQEGFYTQKIKKMDWNTIFNFPAASNHILVADIKAEFVRAMTINEEKNISDFCLTLEESFKKYTASYLKEKYFNQKEYGGSISEASIIAFFPSPNSVKTFILSAIDKNSVEYQKSVNKEKYVQEFLLWRSSLLSALKTWEPFYANCTLEYNISKLPAEIGNSNNLSQGISADIALLLSTSPIKYEALSKGITELLETKFTATWAAQQYEDYKAISLPNANKIIGFINSCILSSELQNCADNQGLANTIKTQEDYTEFMKEFKAYKENLRAALLGIKINNPDSLPDTLIIDLKLFYENYAAATIGAIKTGAPTIGAIERMIKEKLSGNYSTIEKTKETLIAWIDLEHENATWLPEQYFLWKRNTMPFPSANAIAAAVHDAYVNVSPKMLQQKMTAWAATVQDSLLKGAWRCLDRKKVLANLPLIFQKGTGSGADSMFVYTEFILPNINASLKTAEFSQKQLNDSVWKIMIDSVATEKFCETKFNDWLKKYGPKEIEQYLLLQTLLPTDIEIDKILSISSCVREQITLPVVEDSVLDVKIVFITTNEGKIVELKAKLRVELDYQKFALNPPAGVMDHATLMVSSLEWLGSDVYGYKSEMLGSQGANVSIDEKKCTVSSIYTRRIKFTMPIKTFLGIFNLDYLTLEGDNGKKINIIEKIIESQGLTTTLVDSEFVEFELSILEIQAMSSFKNDQRAFPRMDISVLTKIGGWEAKTEGNTERETFIDYVNKKK